MRDTVDTTHTPGPWYCTSKKNSTLGHVGTSPLRVDVATTWLPAAKADARLIAAAPDLLAVVRRILDEADMRPSNPIGHVVAHVIPEARKAWQRAMTGEDPA